MPRLSTTSYQGSPAEIQLQPPGRERSNTGFAPQLSRVSLDLNRPSPALRSGDTSQHPPRTRGTHSSSRGDVTGQRRAREKGLGNAYPSPNSARGARAGTPQKSEVDPSLLTSPRPKRSCKATRFSKRNGPLLVCSARPCAVPRPAAHRDNLEGFLLEGSGVGNKINIMNNTTTTFKPPLRNRKESAINPRWNSEEQQ